jgi:hypothetical protein
LLVVRAYKTGGNEGLDDGRDRREWIVPRDLARHGLPEAFKKEIIKPIEIWLIIFTFFTN